MSFHTEILLDQFVPLGKMFRIGQGRLLAHPYTAGRMSGQCFYQSLLDKLTDEERHLVAQAEKRHGKQRKARSC